MNLDWDLVVGLVILVLEPARYTEENLFRNFGWAGVGPGVELSQPPDSTAADRPSLQLSIFKSGLSVRGLLICPAWSRMISP